MHMATPRSTMSAKVGSCAGSRLCNRELGPLPNIRFGACGVRTGFVSPESPQTKTGPLWILAFEKRTRGCRGNRELFRAFLSSIRELQCGKDGSPSQID